MRKNGSIVSRYIMCLILRTPWECLLCLWVRFPVGTPSAVLLEELNEIVVKYRYLLDVNEENKDIKATVCCNNNKRSKDFTVNVLDVILNSRQKSTFVYGYGNP